MRLEVLGVGFAGVGLKIVFILYYPYIILK